MRRERLSLAIALCLSTHLSVRAFERKQISAHCRFSPAAAFLSPLRIPTVAMRRNILALSLVALSALVPFTSARIVETLTFADVKAAGQERLTLFHFSTDPKSAELVSMLEEAATQLQALRLPALERFSFAEVDCVKPSNAGECSAAGFAAGKDWLFTSTQASGIQAYTGARTASAVATHVHHKFLPADPALVQTWKDEESFFRSLDGPRAKPVFLKFWEEWYTHAHTHARERTNEFPNRGDGRQNCTMSDGQCGLWSGQILRLTDAFDCFC